VAGVVLAVVLAAAAVIQTHRGGDASRTPAILMHSPDVRLAAIQLGHQPGPRNGFLGQFSGVLDILQTDCPANTRQGLADMVTRSMRQLRHSGIPSTPNQVLGGVVGAVDLGAHRECSGIFDRYVAKRRRKAAQAASSAA
jgi:hypothetical protein